jgi:hypothetical protein
MSTIPIFWDLKFAAFLKFNLAEVEISNGRKFLVNFEVNDTQILIPGRLTFGGFFPIDGKAIKQNEFMEILENFTSKFMSAHGLIWKLPPSYFFAEIFSVQQLPDNSSCLAKVIDVNQHIEPFSWSMQKMSRGNQKKHRQAVEANIVHKRARIEDIEKCYKVLSGNREAIGTQVSMSEIEIRNSMTYYPEIYNMEYLELSREVLAMCFTIEIASKVRYVLYWADNLKFRNYSPIALLCEKLVKQAKMDGIEVLDLGISSVDGILNNGLYRFKQNLGAIESSKRTLFQVGN